MEGNASKDTAEQIIEAGAWRPQGGRIIEFRVRTNFEDTCSSPHVNRVTLPVQSKVFMRIFTEEISNESARQNHIC